MRSDEELKKYIADLENGPIEYRLRRLELENERIHDNLESLTESVSKILEMVAILGAKL